jgi:hypothetical protein
MTTTLTLGQRRSLDGKKDLGAYALPADRLLTHGVIVGMTGSGKTGLVTVLVEEALRAEIPVLVIDLKGDLPNLALAFPSFDPALMTPWVEPAPGDADGVADPPLVAEAIAARQSGLSRSGIGERELAALAARSFVRVITPGSQAGESLHLLSSLERRSARWDGDPTAPRAALSAAISLVLRLIGRDGDPGRSKEHALLSVLAERRLGAGRDAPLEALLGEVLAPPVETVGALAVDDFLPPRLRRELAADLNTLLATPSFRAWREGQSVDVGRWMEKVDGRTPATVVSVAHLDDDERMLVLGVILEEVLGWVRGLSGSSRLRALVVFDEVYGYLPPHPASPPTKRPLVALMKQARAFGVGCVLATQNPMDLDYRALGNAGTWCLGRLQTDADRARVLDGLGEDGKKGPLAALLKKLGPRWFLVRDAASERPSLLFPRWAMSYLRGPMTQEEIRRARARELAPGSPAQR